MRVPDGWTLPERWADVLNGVTVLCILVPAFLLAEDFVAMDELENANAGLRSLLFSGVFGALFGAGLGAVLAFFVRFGILLVFGAWTTVTSRPPRTSREETVPVHEWGTRGLLLLGYPASFLLLVLLEDPAGWIAAIGGMVIVTLGLVAWRLAGRRRETASRDRLDARP